jgi:hypothetical protein
MRRSLALGPGLVLFALLVTCVPAAAQMTAGAISLQIAPGARADAMGTAYTAVANDAYATWWNPAGLGFLGEDLGSSEPLPRGRCAAVTFSKLVPDFFDDVYYSYATYAQKLGQWSGFGISVPFITYGDIPIVKAAEGGGSGIEIGTHTPAEFAAVFGYGTRLRSNIGVGASVKVYRADLAPAVLDPGIDLPEGATGTTFAADLGFLYRSSTMPLALGAAMLNLGPDITFVKARESSPLPRVLKMGAAYTLVTRGSSSVLGALDVTKPFVELRDELIYGGGLEYAFAWGQSGNIALRVGYYSEKEGDIQDPTFGIGIGWKGFRYDFVSFPQSSVLDYVTRHSIQFSW